LWTIAGVFTLLSLYTLKALAEIIAGAISTIQTLVISHRGTYIIFTDLLLAAIARIEASGYLLATPFHTSHFAGAVIIRCTLIRCLRTDHIYTGGFCGVFAITGAVTDICCLLTGAVYTDLHTGAVPVIITAVWGL
jgi:hypothetical protein